MKKILLMLAMIAFTSKSYADAGTTNLIASFLVGVGITKILKPAPKYWPDPHAVQSRVEPHPDCFNNPYYGNYRAAIAWERGCLAKQKQLQYKMEQEAYRQGYGRTW